MKPNNNNSIEACEATFHASEGNVWVSVENITSSYMRQTHVTRSDIYIDIQLHLTPPLHADKPMPSTLKYTVSSKPVYYVNIIQQEVNVTHSP